MYFTYKRSTPILYDFIKFGSTVIRIKNKVRIGIICQSQVDIKITEGQNKLQVPYF